MIKNKKKGVWFFVGLTLFILMLMIIATLNPNIFKHNYAQNMTEPTFESLMSSKNLSIALETMMCAGVISQTGLKQDEDKRNHLTKNAFIFSQDSGENIGDLIFAYSKGTQASIIFKEAGDIKSLNVIYDRCRDLPINLPNQNKKRGI